MSENLDKLRKIKMLVLDVDGVLTDARIYMDANNEWKRFFSVRDGVGVKRLVESGYILAIITGSTAPDIRSRVKTLGIHHLYEGALNKIPFFSDLLSKTNLKPEEVAYMGDDHFDIPLLEQVGFAATVTDAMEEVFEHADYVAKRPAGNGAVREVCDMIYRNGAFAEKTS